MRFSFPVASEFKQFCQAFCGKPFADIRPRHATFLNLADSAGAMLDSGLVLVFPGPASFTGEWVLEFQGHGGVAVLQAVVAHAQHLGHTLGLSLRLAQAGEFTQRAFLNDKLDLAQAEAVADLIDATSSYAVKAAAASLKGVFSELVNALAEQIVHLRLLLEATLDFPEEEIDFLEKANAKGQLVTIVQTHRRLLASAREGLKMRDGLRVVLAGRPNVGKSSLLNALAGQDVAIVTPVAGTTRDRIEQELHIRGIPLVIVDTAGLRDTTDEVERMGIERTHQAMAQADLLVDLMEAGQAEPELPEVADLANKIPVLRVINKMDLLHNANLSAKQSYPELTPLLISVKTGQGLEAFKDKLLEMAGLSHQPEHAFIARQRHINALLACEQHLQNAHEFAQQDDRILDLFAEELRLAHDSLGEITGKMLPDDLLGLIFSRFCIGK